jgi:chromosome segregation ATPase
VTYLSRRDYRARTVTEGMDARTNTAIKGLSEAYDRVEAERARLEEERDAWQARALTAEAELAALRQRPGSATKRRRSPPVD